MNKKKKTTTKKDNNKLIVKRKYTNEYTFEELLAQVIRSHS